MHQNPRGVHLAMISKSILLLFAAASCAIAASVPPAVFPLPQEMHLEDNGLVLGEPVRILLPAEPTAQDVLLARHFAAELGDRFGLSVRPERVARVPEAGPAILIGRHTNPLVAEICRARGLAVDAKEPGAEGYVLHVDERVALVAGSDDAGAFYGLQTLRQLLTDEGGRARIRGARMRDWPHMPFRGIRLYLPGQENIAFFKRFLRDFMALYKFNRVIVEMNACMRFDRHPELNAGWREFAKDLNYSRRERPAGPGDYFMNSSHHDTADGGVLEKSEVADIVAFAREHHIDVIPEIPSLTHSYYLLTRHRELAEIQDAEWPDTYCPADPRSYQLIFDVLDEYVEVMKPRVVHIGHDEWRMPTGLDPRCKDQDIRDLFVQDIVKIHAHLARKGVATALWGDHFLENLRGKHLKRQKSRSGYVYDMPGALTPEQVRQSIPKDILVLNWFWNDKHAQKSEEGTPSAGEYNDEQLSKWGFRQVWGNLNPELSWQNFARRSTRTGVLGGASSSWAATTEFNFGKDLLWVFLGTQNMLWSRHWPERTALLEMVQSLIPSVRRRLGGVVPPSDDGDPVAAIELRTQQTAKLPAVAKELAPSALGRGTVTVGRARFELTEPAAAGGRYAVVVSNHGTGEPEFPIASEPITIGEDVSSLLFLHALARPSGSQIAYRLIHNFADAADLLGWYEVTYEDGFSINVPVRYGVNILEWNWPTQPEADRICYTADPVQLGAGGDGQRVTFFAFEWTNPRLGKAIRQIRLHGSQQFRNSKPFPADPAQAAPIPTNAIMLRALSVVQKRAVPGPAQARPFESKEGS